MFNVSEKISELKSSILYIVFLAGSLLIGLTWLSIGLYNALKLWIGTPWSSFVLALIMLVPVIIHLLIKAFSPDRPTKANTLSSQARPAVDPSGALLSQIMGAVAGQSTLIVTVVTLLASFIAVRFPSFLGMFAQVVTAFVDDMKLRPTAAATPPRKPRRKTAETEE
ncbi:hypothetical protein OVA03_14300 [Asticcacaulis sp. SL142]|uniref:hypothetical protein n=1 Tax=Asticcacaulis sp. SL142 TaxID=2995155 RepID=UPI00226CD4C9|nr:hypothetical protein [Asticcacaulis sp. SL142]WAC47859.1 hypothetical protein OVA03_14300 [Asticcacaulis sp. SL142]